METSKQRIIVPDCTARELIARAGKRIDTDEDFEFWDFVTDERGKGYETMYWTPDVEVSTMEVRAYFKRHCFCGNTAAFVALMTERRPRMECCFTISEDDRMWHNPKSGEMSVPCYYRSDGRQELFLRKERVRYDFSDTFVAFREWTD